MLKKISDIRLPIPVFALLLLLAVMGASEFAKADDGTEELCNASSVEEFFSLLDSKSITELNFYCELSDGVIKAQQFIYILGVDEKVGAEVVSSELTKRGLPVPPNIPKEYFNLGSEKKANTCDPQKVADTVIYDIKSLFGTIVDQKRVSDFEGTAISYFYQNCGSVEFQISRHKNIAFVHLVSVNFDTNTKKVLAPHCDELDSRIIK